MKCAKNANITIVIIGAFHPLKFAMMMRDVLGDLGVLRIG
jgi:hypothetical protein